MQPQFIAYYCPRDGVHRRLSVQAPTQAEAYCAARAQVRALFPQQSISFSVRPA